ncbi:hypothetical protein MA16_Dca021546 [Dendrobium catenatum]|uniref:Uncharacterized protein n=1 Tax=Dendrobium catenatum TaxID=906689 RepID=A0A2I0VTZ2_9ASPA|nr:hypothetical protein MA16_Dca021546 [Dendrobium catenatum]
MLLMACPMAAERLEGWEAFIARLANENNYFGFAICRGCLAFYLLRRRAAGEKYEAIGHVLLPPRKTKKPEPYHGERKVSLPLGSSPLDGVRDNYGFFPSIHWKKGNPGQSFSPRFNLTYYCISIQLMVPSRPLNCIH